MANPNVIPWDESRKVEDAGGWRMPFVNKDSCDADEIFLHVTSVRPGARRHAPHTCCTCSKGRSRPLSEMSPDVLRVQGVYELRGRGGHVDHGHERDAHVGVRMHRHTPPDGLAYLA